MKIYRYYKAVHALSVLTDLEIRTSVPNTLNDPFELSPNIDACQFTQSRCEAFLRAEHNIEMWYQREGRSRGFTSKKQFKRWYLKDIPRRAAELLPNVPKNVEEARVKFADTFSKYWRLICASRVHDSILMWSHYADNHAGVVIEFTTTESPFSEIGNDFILPVEYSEQKPEYLYCNTPLNFQRMMFAVASAKARGWEYEQEIRIVIAALPDILRADRYLPLTPKCITGVVLGCRSSAATKASVREVLSRPGFEHVQRLEAHLHPSEYALTFAAIA